MVRPQPLRRPDAPHKLRDDKITEQLGPRFAIEPRQSFMVRACHNVRRNVGPRRPRLGPVSRPMSQKLLSAVAQGKRAMSLAADRRMPAASPDARAWLSSIPAQIGKSRVALHGKAWDQGSRDAVLPVSTAAKTTPAKTAIHHSVDSCHQITPRTGWRNLRLGLCPIRALLLRRKRLPAGDNL